MLSWRYFGTYELCNTSSKDTFWIFLSRGKDFQVHPITSCTKCIAGWRLKGRSHGATATAIYLLQKRSCVESTVIVTITPCEHLRWIRKQPMALVATNKRNKNRTMWTTLRVHLHQMTESILRQCSDDLAILFFLNNGVTPEWGGNPFLSDSIVSMRTVWLGHRGIDADAWCKRALKIHYLRRQCDVLNSHRNIDSHETDGGNQYIVG